jgi:AcrR family transcriptional regulator
MSRKVGAVKTGGDARRERWREHREGRRAEFVAATVRALGEHGPDVGMEEIAAEAQVSKPVLYRYFSDKADLYLAVAHFATELLMASLRPAFDESGSARQRISRLVDTYFSFLEWSPELYRFVLRRNFADLRGDNDPVASHKAVIANSLSKLIGTYTRSFGLDSGGVEVWSHGLVGMVQAAGDWWLERQVMSRADLTLYQTQIIWHALDGFLRSGGIELDPDKPLDGLGEFGPERDDSTVDSPEVPGQEEAT